MVARTSTRRWGVYTQVCQNSGYAMRLSNLSLCIRQISYHLSGDKSVRKRITPCWFLKNQFLCRETVCQNIALGPIVSCCRRWRCRISQRHNAESIIQVEGGTPWETNTVDLVKICFLQKPGHQIGSQCRNVLGLSHFLISSLGAKSEP